MSAFYVHLSTGPPPEPSPGWDAEPVVHRAYWTEPVGGRRLTDDEVAALRAAGLLSEED